MEERRRGGEKKEEGKWEEMKQEINIGQLQQQHLYTYTYISIDCDE